jgi:hypothetical protein
MALSDAPRINGFVGDERKKAEVEEVFGVTVSSDDTLWDDNEFAKYIDKGVWKQVAVERVVLLGTYIALNYLTKLSCRMDATCFEEFVELPLFGKKSHNKWVVHGYVSPTVRIVRALDGSASYGQWYLMTLEEGSTPSRMIYHLMQQNRIGCAVSFEL